MSDQENTLGDNIGDTAAAVPAGNALARARAERGLTIQDVCNHLRISIRQVHALETDDFSALPEPTITRGFIRNYARLLGIPAEPLLQVYRDHLPADQRRPISIHSANILITVNRKRHWLNYALAAIVGIVLVAGWFFTTDYAPKYVPRLAAENEPSPQPADQQMPLALPQQAAGASTGASAENTLPTEKPQTGKTAEISRNAPLPAADKTANAAASAGADAKPSASAATNTEKPPAGNVADSRTAQASGPLSTLKFTFSDVSWVRVIDANGKEIFNKRKAAGSEDQIEGQPPLKVVIGNAAGSALLYNDKPVELEQYSNLNVARFTLE